MIAHRPPLWLPLALAALLVAACGDDSPTAEPGAPGDPPADDRGDDPGDDTGEGPGEGEDGPDDADHPERGGGADDEGDVGEGGDEDGPLGVATERALEDAAERTGADVADIEVVEVEEVTWSDGALGCPKPGEFHTQALVEGYRIVLEADGETLSYHGANGEEPFLCEDPEQPRDR